MSESVLHTMQQEAFEASVAPVDTIQYAEYNPAIYISCKLLCLHEWEVWRYSWMEFYAMKEQSKLEYPKHVCVYVWVWVYGCVYMWCVCVCV